MGEAKKLTTFAYVLMAVLLVIGIAIGLAIGRATVKPVEVAPSPGAAPGLTGTVQVGALIPLTGVLSSFGAQYKVVLEFVEKEVNDYLAILNKPWRIKFVIEDTATDPKTHLDKLMALHGKGIRIFVGGASSAELRESLTYADANKILIISPSSTSPALALRDFALRYTPNDVYQGKAIAEIMWQLGARWVVPVWRGDTWGDGLKEFTEKRFMELCKASGESCGFLPGIRYDPAAKEFTAEATKLNTIVGDAVARYGKDRVAVLMISFEESAALIAACKAYTVLSEVRWYGSDGTAGTGPLLDPAVADFTVKTRMVHTMASPGISPHTEKIRSLIREKLGTDPIGYTYFVYDIAWTIALTLDAVGVYDSEAVLKALPKFLERYMGASGYIVLDENGDRAIADFDLWMIRIKDGKPEWYVGGLYRGLTGTVEWYS